MFCSAILYNVIFYEILKVRLFTESIICYYLFLVRVRLIKKKIQE